MSEKNLIEEYVRYLEKVRNFRTNTLRNHKSECLLWLKYLADHNLELCKVTEDNLISWIDYRQNAMGVKDATIAKGLCVLRTLYEYLFQYGQMTRNPAAALPDLICRPPAEKEYLTAKECFGLLDAFDTNTVIGFRNYILLALMWSTGLRTNEVCSLDWRDINLDEGTLLVRSGKGGKQRFLFLNDRIWEDLKKYHKRLGGKGDAPLFYAFTMNGASKEKWARLSCKQLVDMVRYHAKNVGITKQVNPLTFRHTFATQMYEAGVSIDDLKEMMGHDDATETTIYIHITLDAARRMLQEHTANHTTKKKGKFMKASISVDDFEANIDDWIKMREKTQHQPSGIKSNRRDVGILSSYLQEQKIAQITGEVILDFITYLCDVRHNDAAAVNRKMSSIKSYLRHLHFRQVEGAAKFPIEYLPRAREPYSGPIQALEPQEVKKILGCIDKNSVLGFRDFLLYSLLYRLGLRIGEALCLSLKDIDLEKQILTIHGKGRRERKLPLVSDLPALIEKWLLLRQMLYGAKDSDAFFISKKGNRLAQRTAQENFQKIVQNAGPLSLDKVTPHSLRHAFASHAIDGEADLIVLKAVLGHARLETTEHYIHPSMRVLQKAVNEHISSQILSELIEENVVVLRVQQQRSCAACGG